MNRKIIGVLLLLTLFVGVQASAFTYQKYNFGNESTLFDYNNNWAPITYPDGIGNLPSPGTYSEGGEKFDLEGLNVATDDRYVYVSLTNSFGYSAYATSTGQNYRLGDLFIGVNGGNKYGYAIDLFNGGNNGLYRVDGYAGINPFKPGTYAYNNAYPGITAQAGAWKMTSGNRLGDVSSVMSFERGLELNPLAPGNGDTYVWEFQFEKDLFGINDISNLDFHINLECGNDLIETTHSAVPEPTTMVLFGLGLAGVGAVRKRRSKKS